MRLGTFLARADHELATRGGYQACVDVEARTVCVFHIDPTSNTRIVHGTGPAPEGIAPEDSARDLLDQLAPSLDADKLAFADTYFVVGFA